MELNQEVKGPSAERVHRRALALAYLACRAMIDVDPSAAEMAGAILQFVRGVGLEDAFEPCEARILQAPFGTLSEFEVVETSWVVEGIAVLAWALGKMELPPFSTKCPAAPVSIALGMFRPGTKETLSEAALRDAAEIESLALSYLALNWRIGRQIENPEKLDFAGQLSDPNRPHLLVDGLELRDGDLTIDGVELGQVGPDRFGEVFTIVRQRFNAFKWLQGYAACYGAEPTLQ
jgi:Domain of unknown function (DUF4272)